MTLKPPEWWRGGRLERGRGYWIGYHIVPLVSPPKVTAIAVQPSSRGPGYWNDHSDPGRHPTYAESGVAEPIGTHGAVLYATRQEAVEAAMIEIRSQLARFARREREYLDWLVERNG